MLVEAKRAAYRCAPQMPVGPQHEGASMTSRLTAVLIASAVVAAALAPLAARADERKQLAFETIDRNAGPMADISDAIFFFGEPGMQEFETTKLLKGTL